MRLVDSSQYQPTASKVFAQVSAQIASVVPYARIEHVGSSAIPGAISKGDIDICVVVPKEQFVVALAMLESQGYCVKPDTLRTEQLCMLISPRKDVDLAVQLIEYNSEFEFFMQFRDALLTDPQLVERYNQVKQQAADLGVTAYREAKSRFIREVLRGLAGRSCEPPAGCR